GTLRRDVVTFAPNGTNLFLAAGSQFWIYDAFGVKCNSVPNGNIPDGAAFHGCNDPFVISNDNNNQITRYNGVNGLYCPNSITVTPTAWATGGFRGDFATVGPDGNAYVSQADARYCDTGALIGQ